MSFHSGLFCWRVGYGTINVGGRGMWPREHHLQATRIGLGRLSRELTSLTPPAAPPLTVTATSAPSRRLAPCSLPCAGTTELDAELRSPYPA